MIVCRQTIDIFCTPFGCANQDSEKAKIKLLFGIESNAALAAVIEGLLHQKHKLRLLLVALAAVCTAKDMVVKCTASDI